MNKDILEQVIQNGKNPSKWNQFFYSACSYYSTADVPLEPPKDSRFSNLKTLGEIVFDRMDRVIVVIADISQDLSERSGKKAQYEEAKRVLKNLGKYPAGLFIFIDPEGRFRMSLVYAQYLGTKIEFNNFRRFTYFVDPMLTNRTFRDWVGLCKFDGLESVKKAFSVEKVNKEFYQKIADFFYQLTGINGAEPKLILPDDTTSELLTVKKFAIRLIGRIIFCWFLKHKKSPANIPLIPEEILSKNAVKEHYYHMVLERLFFELMNKPYQGRQPDIGIYLPQHKQIPFLNGGLFDPHKDDFYQEGANWGLKIPDRWFTGFFQVLERYNFTIDENSPVDAEVSVDPEMMGRIFENLLAEINPATGESARKASGSYYTPRIIVDYMVEQSLNQYLLTSISLGDTKISDLLSYEKELKDWKDEEKEAVVRAFNKIRVLDPACGSGAFPMGILQRMIIAMEKVDPDLDIWLKKFLSQLDTIARQTIEKHIQRKNWAYIRKLLVIRDSIYGVDIQPIAVEIAKLRCFLSLVVDEIVSDTEPNRGIETLPNLEFKFVAANSLIALPGAYKYNQPKGEVTGKIMPMPIGEESDLIGKLARLRKEYFTSYGERKKEIEKEFSLVQQQMIEAIAKTPAASATNLIGDTTKLEEKTKSTTFMLAGWKPFSNEASEWFNPEWMFGVSDGFDIIIGNPPYISTERLQEPQKSTYSRAFHEIHSSRIDVYCYFYYRGLEITRDTEGVLCYISSNKWMRAAYGKKLRKYFTSKNPILLIDLGPDIFENATVDTCILLIQNKPNGNTTKALTLTREARDSNLAEFINQNAIEISGLSEKTWFIGSDAQQRLKLKIEEMGKPLEDWDVSINYGIKTGLNEAFIIGSATKEKLCQEDSRSAEILKPLLRGRDIKRYHYEWAGLWLILAKYGSNKYIQDDYPAIFRHLLKYEEKLRDRGQCKYTRARNIKNGDYGGQHHWIELDNNPNEEYTHLFEKEKIVWKALSVQPAFCYDSNSMYCNDKCNILTSSENNLHFLTSYLNSKLFQFLFKNIGVGMGYGFEYKIQFVKQIPVPVINKENNAIVYEIKHIASNILSINKDYSQDATELEYQIDQLVYQLYDLTPDEIAIVEGNNEKP